MEIKDTNSFSQENQEDRKYTIPTEKDMEMSWDNVDNYKDEYPKPDMGKMWKNTRSKLEWENKTRTIHFRKYFFRYAAAIFIPLMIVAIGIYYSIEKINLNKGLITYVSPEGMSTRLNLSDGSTIWVQPNSEIKYPKYFNSEKREIYFTGQAYFDIEHNSECPFEIHVGNMDITVLGTQFYVKAKTKENLIETGLVSGKINISGEDCEKLLAPGDLVIFSKKANKIIETKALSSNAYTWNLNNMVFDDCPLGIILRDISDWYDIDYQIDPKIDLNKRITLTIREESIQEILEILKIVVPFEYKISENRITYLSVK